MVKKPHTIYKLKSGMRVPGVTTITGELGWSKQVLINWANRLGLQGIDSKSFVDDKAAIGTLGHLFILDHFKKAKTDTSEYSKVQIDQAENCLMSFWAWEKGKKIEPKLLEQPLVSEKYRFGGSLDAYALIDGRLTLLDFKTGKGIYSEHLIQVAGGYLLLLEEHGYKVDNIQILNIPRSEGESFQIKDLPLEKWQICKDIFLSCLKIYNLKYQLDKGE